MMIIIFCILVLVGLSACMPILIYRYKKFLSETPRLVMASIEKMPVPVLKYFDNKSMELDRCGFQKIMDIMDKANDKYFRYYINRKVGDTAIAVFLYTQRKIHDEYVEFRTVFTHWGDSRYKIVFSSDISDDNHSNEVKQKLAKALGMKLNKMERFLAGKRAETKANLTLDKAIHFKEKIEQAGAACEIVEVPVQEQQPDIQELITTNTMRYSSVPESQHKIIIRKPDLTDATQLYKVHRRKSAKIGKDAKSVVPSMGNETAYLSESIQMDINDKLSKGYLFFSEQEHRYRYTWAGAYAATWAIVFFRIQTIFSQIKNRIQSEKPIKSRILNKD